MDYHPFCNTTGESMSSSDFNLFFKESIRVIKEKDISVEEYNLWFDKLEFHSFEENILSIYVPSKFYRDQVSQRYLDLIESRLRELTGNEGIKITFAIKKADKEQAKPIKERPKVEPVASAVPSFETKEPKATKKHPLLQQKYDFESFVIGNNNSFAANAAKAIAENPGSKYNPYLIYGGVGLGKTHLMQAIGNHLYNSNTSKKIVYIPAETFINEFIYSIRTTSQQEFKNKYRKVDLLLIDDIHDLQGKRETQEELFHTFNALYDLNKQMVFTCDRPPSELKDFNDRLKSRFQRGLNVDLQPPNFETRVAILNKKIEELKPNTEIPLEVIEFISKNVSTNIRDLEASLTRIIGYCDLVNKNINIEIAQNLLSQFFTSPVQTKISIKNIQKTVSDYFNISTDDIKGKRRTRQIAFPRQIAMYICREITDYSTTEIGQEFGGKDHTTVMHAHQRIKDRMTTDSTLEPIIGELIRNIKNV